MGDTSTGSEAAAYKEQGNAKFKSGDFQQAAEWYAKAIDLDHNNAVLFSNRSNAFLQLNDLQKALEDAAKATSLKPSWDKGWYRTGCALEAQGRLEEALRAYQTALDCSPSNEQILSKVRALKQQQKNTAKQQQRKDAKAQQKQQQQVSPGIPGPAAWASGLTHAQQAEWLVDCYRMRVDDDYCWGGGNIHGLYDPEATSDTVAADFLTFCKLAVKAGVLPAGWDWPGFLRKAQGLLPCAFEKSDAKDKWGGENVFAAAMGGRSLRYTGELVYGSSCMSGGEESADAEQLLEEAEQQWSSLVAGQASSGFFGDVGGAEAWLRLRRGLATAMRRQGR
ncbi:hypothetical protein OEZ86_006436 [Tetradesmus obliquus]|nr:hypothetical protein OEZ86_006436 [Tetradesmus obliquus]